MTQLTTAGLLVRERDARVHRCNIDPKPITAAVSWLEEMRQFWELPDGEPFWTTGAFIEVDAPRRLVYTWLWSGAPEAKATRVTIDFHDRGGKTEVVLRHDRFPDLNMRNEHQQGWTHCFDQLDEYLKKEEKKS